MLFQEIDFTDTDIRNSLRLKAIKPVNGWQGYYESYAYTLCKIIEAGVNKSYPYNCNARAILFLIRHSLELSLKLNLHLQGSDIPIFHGFADIAAGLGGIDALPREVQELIKIINFDEDGSCYRYPINPGTGKWYFPLGSSIETAEYFQFHQELVSSKQFNTSRISPDLHFTKNITRWNLTFHMGESTNLWHIRNHYNGLAEILIQGVLSGTIELGKVYIPLLFLIRHSLELALKANINDVKLIYPNFATGYKPQEHSLVTLFNFYDDFLGKLDTSNMEEETRKVLLKFREQFRYFNLQIHDLDYNSLYFRFPTNKQGVPHNFRSENIDLHEMLKLYYFTDKFLSFTNNVLEDYGLLPVFHEHVD